MYKYFCVDRIDREGLLLFTEDYIQTDKISEADCLFVRSTDLRSMKIPDQVKIIARAGAGISNLPLEECKKRKIKVVNTPGANANGVKELVIAGMLLASRGILQGVRWVENYAEKEKISIKTEKVKKNFAGCELKGKKAGVIGLGAIGSLVADTLKIFGMNVYGCDPYLTEEKKKEWEEKGIWIVSQEEIYKNCDYITIHVPEEESTKGMIGKEELHCMKEGTVLLNFSRSSIVDEGSILYALEKGKIKRYVTDFPTDEIRGEKGVLAIPHLGASTKESEENCAKEAVKKVMKFFDEENFRKS